MAEDLGALEDKLTYRFREPGLLERAVTHASWAHEHPPAAHNETLAFLGDAVLALVVAEALVGRMPGEGPGPLTQARAEVVSGRSLAAGASRLGLGEHLRLGRGEDLGGGRAKESVLATAFEAVLGALYLDGGLAAARPAVLALMADVVG